MIHVLPGMAADHAMYPAPWHTLPESQFLDWPAYAGEDSITAIAARVADEAGVRDGDIIIGTSLGGIVGCEIARLRRLGGLFLVSSAKRKEEISGLLAALHPLAQLAPVEFIQRAAGKIPHELAATFSRSHAGFIRAMCRAIFEWEGLDETRIAPLRLHGKSDPVIPLPAGVQKIVDGGHLIVRTHATACVDFVRSRLPARQMPP